MDCYDKNPESAQLSRDLLTHLKLTDKINITTKKGEELDKIYDVIIIALLAKPKDKILREFLKQLPRLE